MKVILKIARQELETLFFSPIAWLILIIFTIQCGISFTDKLAMFEASQYGGNTLQSLTIHLFSSGSGFFAQLQKYLYLYIPLLTMGLMSRETSSGTIKLLFSSPIKLTSIIFGKYLSTMAYGLLLTVIMLMICSGGVYAVEHIDTGMLFSGLLGIFLLISAYAAIGLYMSCITSYQMIAALSTLVVLGVLSYIGGVWQNIAFVRDITYFLSINGRASHFFFGLISSKDIFYFILVISLFLFLAIMKLQDDRRARNFPQAAIRYTGLLLVILCIGYLSSLPSFTFYLDVNAEKSNTLTKNSQDLVRQLDKPLKITSYVNILDPGSYVGLPANQLNDIQHFENYARFKADIQIDYVYYYDQPLEDRNRFKNQKELIDKAKRRAEAERLDFDKILPPAAIHKIIDLRTEKNRFVRQLTYEGKKTFLRMFNDPEEYPSEQEISVSLKRLLVKPPKIAFISGHDEPNIESQGDTHYNMLVNYPGSRSSLINLGYDVCDLSLQKEIPADVDVLVLADPRQALQPVELGRLHHFIEKGGSMLIAGEPGRQALLNPIIAPLGLQLEKGTVIQDTKDMGITYILGKFPVEVAKTYPFSEIASYQLPVTLPGAAVLTYKPNHQFKAVPVLVTDSHDNWNRLTPLSGDSIKLTYRPEAGDQKGVMPLAYTLSREKEGKHQHIMVIGDATFFSNGELNRQSVGKANFVFAQSIFGWMTGGTFPVDVNRPQSQDNVLRVTRDDVFLMKVIYLGIIPILIGLAGALLLISRKKN